MKNYKNIIVSEEVSNKLKVFEDIKLLILKHSIYNTNIILENGGILTLDFYKNIPVFKLVVDLFDNETATIFNIILDITTGNIYIEKDGLKYLCESPNDILKYMNI